MIKVFEDFDIALVGHYQSVLEANGIETFMKNQFGTSGAGELPFVEVVPQLWVLDEKRVDQARELIGTLRDQEGQNPASNEAWRCESCGTEQEGVFTHCWNCSSARAGSQPEK